MSESYCYNYTIEKTHKLYFEQSLLDDGFIIIYENTDTRKKYKGEVDYTFWTSFNVCENLKSLLEFIDRACKGDKYCFVNLEIDREIDKVYLVLKFQYNILRIEKSIELSSTNTTNTTNTDYQEQVIFLTRKVQELEERLRILENIHIKSLP